MSAAIAVLSYLGFLVYRIMPVSFGSVVYYCQSVMALLVEYIPLLIAAIVLLAGTVWILLWRRRMQVIRALDMVGVPERVWLIITRYGVRSPIRVFRSVAPMAFCFGIRRPEIFLSTGLLSTMNQEELTAIILHESEHIRQNDTRTISLLRFLSGLLLPFPYFWEITHAYSVVQEIRADTAVRTNMRTAAHLKSALHKLLSQPTSLSLPQFALQFSGYQAYSARIQAIHDEPISIRISFSAIYFSLASLALVSVILAIPVTKTEYRVKNERFVVMCYQSQSCEISCVRRPNMSIAPN